MKAVEDTLETALPEWAGSLVISNELDATLWCAYRESPAPSAADHDFAVPGSALYCRPLPSGARNLAVTVDYVGAVPAGDAGLIATVAVVEPLLAPFVGPLS
jgi:hypothetical protein